MTFQPGAKVYTQGFGSRPEGVEVPHNDTRAPAITDILYPVGKRWVNTLSNTEYTLTSQSTANNVTSSTWTLLGTNTGALNTLSDGSTTVTPTAGNIEILGTASQITSTGTNSPGAITLSLPSSITTPGSLTTTTTLSVGTNATVAGTLGVTGTTTLAAVGATNGTFSGTLGVTGTSTLHALTQTGTASINASGASNTTIGTGGTGFVQIGNATGNTEVTGSLTASTGLVATTGGVTATAGGVTATAGDITATAGDLIATAGNLDLNGAASKINLNVATGASASAGVVALALGVATVTTSAATTSSLIFVSYNSYGSAAGGFLTGAATPALAGSFIIKSSDTTDSTSTVNWWVIN